MQVNAMQPGAMQVNAMQLSMLRPSGDPLCRKRGAQPVCGCSHSAKVHSYIC